jgi:branched-chain amino acid transport system substrate-binding protein
VVWSIRDRKWFVLVGLLLAAALLLTCAGCKGPKAPAPVKPPPMPKPTGTPYKIGAMFAITGDASSLGEPEKNTAEMLEKSINDAGGINGHPIDIIIEDTAGDNTRCLSAAQKLVDKDNVLAVVGPSRTGTTLAVIDLFESKQVPLISCAAGIEIVEPVRKWVFKTPQSDRMAVQRIIDYLKKKGITKVACINDNTGFGKGGTREIEKLFPAAGITNLMTLEYGPKDSDMTAQVTKVKGTQAQAVISWGTPPGPAIVVKNMRAQGMTIPFIGSHGIANTRFIDVAGKAAEGVVFPAGRLIVRDQIPADNKQKPVLDEYADAYMKAYGKQADTFGGHAWDAIQLLKLALEKAGDNRAGIRDAIEGTKDFVGTGGIFNFSPTDHNGLTKEAFVMVEIKDGKWTLIGD